MSGSDYPVSDYYKPHVREGHTIVKANGWWSAVLLIEDPRSGPPFVSLYRWQLTEDGWKMRKSSKCADKTDLKQIVQILNELSDRL